MMTTRVVYNFRRVCMSVRQTITFESFEGDTSQVRMFVYEGHRVTVKVTVANKVQHSYSGNPAM